MKHILVITFSNLKTDSRVRRHVNSLKKKYKLTVACFEADPTTEYDLILLKPESLTLLRKAKLAVLLGLRLFHSAYRTQHPYFSLADTISGKLDLIIANDAETFPLAFHIAEQQNCPVVFDAHEYAPRHFEDKLVWRLFFQPLNMHLCRKYIPRVKAMFTVGKGLANEYEKNFNVKPDIITNASYYHELEPSPVQGNSVRLVHHGIATPSRKLELMIDMMDHLDERFTLDMYLLSSGFVSVKTKNYPAKLKELAARNPRVRILDPIKSELIVRTINTYDMGVFLIPPVNFNYENTLPNKLFDFIQARLAVAVGPTPEMAEIVNHYDLGIVSGDFTARALAKAIQAITPEKLTLFKENSTTAAKQLNAEENEKILFSIVEKSLN
jgi:glycosyltransferase involved in cell wall biosynthesis